MVIPAELRDALGLRAGEVEIVIDGAGLRIDVPAEGRIVEESGRLVIRGAGTTLTDDDVRALRLADQR